jgi:hypothetical protein
MATMQKITTVLKQCDLELSLGDLLVLDKHAEIDRSRRYMDAV